MGFRLWRGYQMDVTVCVNDIGGRASERRRRTKQDKSLSTEKRGNVTMDGVHGFFSDVLPQMSFMRVVMGEFFVTGLGQIRQTDIIVPLHSIAIKNLDFSDLAFGCDTILEG